MVKHARLILALGLTLAASAVAQGVNPPTTSGNPPTAGGNPPVATNAPSPYGGGPSPYGGNWEFFVGGSMQFARARSVNSVPLSTTNVIGPQIGLRLHLNDYNAIEVRDNMAWPVQSYGNSFKVRARSNEFAFDWLYTEPTAGAVRPFLLAGVSWFRFSPTGSGNTPGAISQNKWGLDYGGGLDFGLTKHLSLRVEYRGVLYKVPDFGLIVISNINHLAEPDAGIVWHF